MSPDTFQKSHSLQEQQEKASGLQIQSICRIIIKDLLSGAWSPCFLNILTRVSHFLVPPFILCREKYEKLVSITIQKYRGKKSNLSTARSVVIAVRFSPPAIPDRQPFPALCPTMALRPLQYVFSHLGTLANFRSWRCFPNAVQTEDAVLFFGGF